MIPENSRVSDPEHKEVIVMDERFIYVFDEDSKDKLERSGYKLIASHKKESTYVFANKHFDDEKQMNFSLDGISYFPSNKLTF